MERLGPSLKETGKKVLRQVIGYEDMPVFAVVEKATVDGIFIIMAFRSVHFIVEGRTTLATMPIVTAGICLLADRFILSGHRTPKKDQ